MVAREHRTVRVDANVLTELEELAQEGLVPATFGEQVEAGLRLLIDQTDVAEKRHSAGKAAANRKRAEETFRKLYGQP